MAKIGIIGGSGLYNIEGLESKEWVAVPTPFGRPSDEYLTGTLGGREIVFLPRHGRGHRIPPSELNYRANIYGMKKLGVEWIISVSAVGSLKEEIRPMDIVIVDQFVDRTNQARVMTFFGDGIVGHIPFADPTCPVLNAILCGAAKAAGATVFEKGTYINMEGPAFSTKAESALYRQWGMDVIGMTNMPEAKLAREAEICYSTMAMVTDYDCWHQAGGSETVSIEMVIQNLLKNVETAKVILASSIAKIPKKRTCACVHALQKAIVTNRKLIPKKKREELKLIIGKYIK
jgi:5'-methylthioadenosine phosphorylase